MSKQYQERLRKWVIRSYRKPLRGRMSIYHMKSQIGALSRRTFWKIVETEKPKNILDVGCGVGRDAEGITCHGVEYVGVDPQKDNIAVCRKEHPEATFKIGFAQDLPFSDNSFEWVLSRGTIELLPSDEDRRIAVRECLRVAQKCVFIVDYGLNPTQARNKDRKTSARYVPKGYKIEKIMLAGKGADDTLRYNIILRIYK